MPKDFIHYDTLFYGEKLVEQHYELKEGSYLILLFWSNGKLFTTIRPHNNQKFKYYFSLIGQEFEIIINKESI